MSLEIIVTTAGRAKLPNANNTGTSAVTITQIGLSSTAVVPTASATSLPGEFKRLSGVSGLVVADDTIHISAQDTSSDAYTLRSFAFYLNDGTLFGIAGQATPILEKTPASIPAISIDVVFADIAAASIAFGNAEFVNPPASTTVSGVVELATVPEAQAGIDALRALTPAAAKAALLTWLLEQDGSGSGTDADLLDGKQGSWYADIVARLGYSPLNASSYNAQDVLAKLVSMDGSGSGIDSDMVDGWHRDDIRRWGNLLDKPFFWDGQPGQPNWLWGSNDGQAYRVWNPANFNVNYANSAGWAGSAGNADTLDGHHWNSFFRVGAISLSPSSGYIGFLLPDNTHFLLQYVSGTIGANQTIFVEYPWHYGSWSKAWLSGMPADSGPYQNPPGIVQNSSSTTGCMVNNGWDSGTIAFTVFAFGV